MVIFIIFIFEVFQITESSTVSKLTFDPKINNLGQKSIIYGSNYFLGTSKNISSNTETNYLLLYSISSTTNSSIFDPIYIPNINPPPLRRYYGIFFGVDEIYIYGGVFNSIVFNDFWRYEINSGVWTNISSYFRNFNLPPLYDYGYTSFRENYYYDLALYNFIIIAGGIDDKENFIDEVWVLLFNQKISSNIFRDSNFISIKGCSNIGLAGLQINRFYLCELYIYSGYRKQNNAENPYYLFNNICYLDFCKIYNNKWYINIHQDFYIYKPAISYSRLFSNYLIFDYKIYKFFGIEFIKDKIIYESAVYSIRFGYISEGWIIESNVDIKADSLSLIKKQDYLYFVEGDLGL